jgi:hypothetical protein
MQFWLSLCRGGLGVLSLGAALLVLLGPSTQRAFTAGNLRARVEMLRSGAGAAAGAACLPRAGLPGRAQRLGSQLASWQSVAGCGASAATGAGAGLKWVGRNVSGGLFGVQCQATYSPLLEDPLQREHSFQLSTLISKEINDRASMGVTVPFVYKYLEDPFQTEIDLSNSGIGDVAVQVTYRLGPIAATAVTASVALPTGTWDTQYKMRYLRQHQQLGFGKPAGSLMVDHNMEQAWGLLVVGAMAGWRGGENELENYRAPSGTAYSHMGVYLGRFVPALGVSVTGFTAHDRDRSEDENSGLLVIAPSASIEWSTDWVALLVGGSLPYQYSGDFVKNGVKQNPWGFGSWMVSFGASFSPL